MLRRIFSYKAMLLLPVILIVSTAAIAWKGSDLTHQSQKIKTDTVPTAEDKLRRQAEADEKQADLEVQISALEKAMQQLDAQLKDKKWEQMQKNVQEAISKIDMDKINRELDEAMKKIDMAKIQAEAQAALSRIDYEKIREQVNEAMKQLKNSVEKKELEKEIQIAMEEAKRSMKEAEKIEFKQVEAELKQAKEQLEQEQVQLKKEMEQMKKELAKEKIDIQSELSEAKKEIAAAKNELVGYREMVTEMEDDGLVNKNEDYTIEFRDGSLYINGNKQPEKSYNKYKSKVKKEKLTIQKQKGRILIDQ